MSSAIFQALKQGFNSKSILGVLAKQSPKLAKAIGAAEAAGYLHNSILKKLVGKESDDSDAYLTEHERTKKRDANRQKRLTRNVASTIGTVGALGAGLASYLDKQSSTQGHAGQPSPGNPPPPSAPAQAAPQQPAPIPPEKQQLLDKFRNLPNALTPTSPQEQAPQAAQPSQTETQFPQALLSVRKQLQNGKTPEEIDEHMRNSVFYRSLVEKYENETQTPFLQKINEISESPQHAQEMTHKPQQMPQKPQEIPQPSQESQMPEKVQNMPSIAVQPTKQAQTPSPLESEASEPVKKGSQVIMPDGRIGSVFHERGNKGVVESEGKKHAADIDQLQPVPHEWENITVDLSKIPENEKSSNLEWVAGDPKQIVIRFWGHKPMLYRYFAKDGSEMPPEILQNITTETDAPVTSGVEFAGAWAPSGKSRGSAFHHRLKLMSQSIDDPDDPEKPFLFQRIPLMFEHGFLLAARETLKIAEKKFNEHFHPPKRKRSKPV